MQNNIGTLRYLLCFDWIFKRGLKMEPPACILARQHQNDNATLPRKTPFIFIPQLSRGRA